MMRRFRAISKLLFTAPLLGLIGANYSYAGESEAFQNREETRQAFQPNPSFDIFAPKKQTLNTRFDYSVWDAALQDSVVQMGPSKRVFARRVRPKSGSILTKSAHNSRYRLEGSRITFHYLSDSYKTALTQYKHDLVQLAHDYDIQSFSRNEQLAFWINLHNVVLIDTISQNHPTLSPSRLVFGVDENHLHEAKLITIKNVPLSLKDIREQIVFKNWKDPSVIYGFFRGDIGGPGIMPYAVTGENVKYVLTAHGFEYATSLRGFQTSKKARKVSKLYHEAQPYFFPNWPQDVERHLKTYLQDTDYLLAQIEQDTPLSLIEYDETTADLWGGDRYHGPALIDFRNGTAATPPILVERFKKLQELEDRGRLKRSYSVKIIDEETENSQIVE